MTDDQLEAALRQLDIDVPEPPDVQAAVLARLSEPRRSILRPILVTAAAVLLAFGVAFAVSPEVRAAVTDILRFAGIEFQQDAPPPLPPVPTVPGEKTITLAEARQRFDVKLPSALGQPQEIRATDRVISLLYKDKRLDQFDGEFGPAMEKFAYAQDIERVTVNGTPGLWIPRPHEILYVDRDGQWQHESARMSGKTLMWQEGGVTLRLEGDFSKEEALRLAAN
ncbi:hypothetical protein LWC34_36550 [Kibdelosporangium philippinense]|uniref:DUF4367 domain-containing protein n=1 Tax=Kibdelosporangium philippinense TaxID=211113 RepID=A0ABS8ZKG9_9PSEU|nr:hypothetical protein [Kibdelosporangium philippinense]MCE7008286.1 hypothetical protein [Kibdelosporangium philippinense]